MPPYNGSGSFSVYTPGNPAVTGTTISSTAFNNTMTDFATGLSNAITRDGQSPATANIPMGGNKITGLGTGTARTDSVNAGQVQDGTQTYLTAVAGTDTITASLSGLTAYATGMTVRFVAAGTNTGAATVNINSLGAKSITKNGTTALVAGDIQIGAALALTYDGTQFQVQSINQSITTIPSAATGTTQSQGDNSTKIATTAYADRAASSRIQPISASVGSNALTISASALTLDFRSTTLGNGTVTTVQGTPANLVVPSSATLGTVNATLSRLVVIALNNAGTIELAVVNISGGNDLTETGLISTTAISASATSASTIYSTTARSSVAYRVIGYIESTQATAGTWATAPSTIQGYGGQALAAMSSLGYGQTWQNVSGSRSLSTTYYNTTGKPISVSVSGYSTAGAVTVSGIVNGSNVAICANTTANYSCTVFFMVPPQSNYSVTISGTPVVQVWAELR